MKFYKQKYLYKKAFTLIHLVYLAIIFQEIDPKIESHQSKDSTWIDFWRTSEWDSRSNLLRKVNAVSQKTWPHCRWGWPLLFRSVDWMGSTPTLPLRITWCPLAWVKLWSYKLLIPKILFQCHINKSCPNFSSF